ncbi:MAG: DUF402 domain-containing protein [Firmicutes bacterium]|nr:DUF402 domain-containing protein [Bacillota bacterium]
MGNIKLYRRRFIPDEKIYLKDDKIIYTDNKKIITKWNTLKKRNDFAKGISCYFLDKGIKVSKFMKEDNELVYWYCDIIDWEYNDEEKSYTFNDLLVDVVIYPDGSVRVLDLGEISEAMARELIGNERVKNALKTTDKLLNIIYEGRFDELKKELENVDVR